MSAITMLIFAQLSSMSLPAVMLRQACTRKSMVMFDSMWSFAFSRSRLSKPLAFVEIS